MINQGAEKLAISMMFREHLAELKDWYAHKRYESVTGVVKDIEGQQGKLTMQVGYESIKINMNNIVSVK